MTLATIDTLHDDLRDLLDALKGGNKDGSRPESQPSPKGKAAQHSIGEAFTQAFNKGKAGGSGIQKMLMDKAGSLGQLSGQGASVAGPIGAIGAPLIALGIELAKLPERVRAFANELHQANRQFAQFSPAMAQVFANSDMQDAMRKMRQGDELADSAGRVADARGRMEDALTPVDTSWQKLQNNFGAVIGNAMSTFLEQSEWAQQLSNALDDVSETLEWIADWLGKKGDKDNQDVWNGELEAVLREEQRKIEGRSRPVAPPAAAPARDPRPDFPWDRGGGGDF